MYSYLNDQTIDNVFIIERPNYRERNHN